MNNSNLLIIFTKNAVIGNVKSRIASKIGEKSALKIHEYLFERTTASASYIEAEKAIYFSDFIPANNSTDEEYELRIQNGDNLGDRMENAFNESFSQGFSKVILIGSDIYNLRPGILNKAFDYLGNNDAVLGPAQDGGYYLIGLKNVHPRLFENKLWSTNTVFKDTIDDFRELNLSYKLLPVLQDIDEIDDLKQFDSLLALVDIEKISVN